MKFSLWSIAVFSVVSLISSAIPDSVQAQGEGKLYFLPDSGEVSNWYENCEGAEDGYGPPLTKSHTIYNSSKTTSVQLSGCYQDCVTADILCDSIIVVQQ